MERRGVPSESTDQVLPYSRRTLVPLKSALERKALEWCGSVCIVAAGDDLGIDFPFQLTIEHPSLTVEQMLQVSQLLDFHEVRAADPALDKARHDLIVDVMSVHETETTIEVKPRRPMTYALIGKELQTIVDTIAERFNGNVRVLALDWLIDRKGLASDMRSSQKRVL